MRASLPGMDKLGLLLPALAPTAAVLALLLFAGAEVKPQVKQHELSPIDMAPDLGAMRIAARPRPTPDAAARARERAAQITMDFELASPFFSVEPVERGGENSAAPERPTPSVDLTALMNTPRGAIAVIDGRPCRVGDRIGGGATIASIDVEARTVTATDASGHAIVLRLRQPGVDGER